MSRTETNRGIIKLVPRLENETLEEQCKRLLKADKVDKYSNTYQEMFEDTFYRQYVIANNDEIYEVLQYEDIQDLSFFKATKNSDGTISFLTSFYNGGCSFSEAIQECLDNMEDK